MSIPAFLIAIILFHLPALGGEKEKLVIAPSNGSVPKAVKKAAQSLGSINDNVGFFIDNGLFVSSITKPENELILGFHEVAQIRKATQQEATGVKNLKKGDVVSVFSGRAKLIKAKGIWGFFKVNTQSENQSFNIKLSRFLKFSEFQKGDKVFILSNFLYNNPNNKYKKQHMIMEVTNSNIGDIETRIDLTESAILDILRHNFHSSIAVNQRGEVIGLIELTSKKGYLTKVTTDLITEFSAIKEKLAEEKRNNGYTLEKPFLINGANKDIPEECLGTFKGIKNIIEYPVKLL